MNKRLRIATAGLALITALTGCGSGGTDDGGVGSGGTGSPVVAFGTTDGVVTGFGSVHVEQAVYDDTALVVQRDVDPSSPQADTTTSVALGQRVTLGYGISGTTLSGSTLTITADIIGRITSIDATNHRFVVAGQTIAESTDVAAPTVYDGASGFGDLTTLEAVSVYGVRDADNVLVASRIEIRDPALPGVTRVVGPIAGLDTTAKTFTIGSLLINYATSTVLPSGAVLANGQRVAVYAPTPSSTTMLTATVVKVQSVAYVEGQQARRSGFVASLDFAAHKFKLGGVDVDASSATYVNGAATDLANGRRVRVIGTFTNGVIVASQVAYVVGQGDSVAQVTGPITDFVSTSSFRVRGVPIDASATTGITFTPTDVTAANLADGVIVTIIGPVVGNVVKPTSITFVDTGTTRTLFGLVSNYDATAGTFRLFDLSMKLDAAATFANADGTAATRANFANNDLATVTGSLNAGVFVVTQVEFRGSFTHTTVEGSLYQFNLTTNRFVLNGSVVQVTSSTVVVGGSLTSLANGAVVQVDGTITGGVLQATTITIQTSSGTVSRVSGFVSGYVSSGQFYVAGQRVDARLATFAPTGTSATNIVNGAFLVASGPVNSLGVLAAVSVTFRMP